MQIGYVCEYITTTVPFYPEKSKKIPSLHWTEGDSAPSSECSNLLKENVTFGEFQNIIEEYKIRYGVGGFVWNTTWNNENSGGGFAGEYVDRGFN